MVHPKSWIRECCFRIWYWYVSVVDRHAEILFMNYGHADTTDTAPIPLTPADEPNRYSIQLYHRLAVEADLHDKQILEIGCGRGGGLHYIARTFRPAAAIGLDLNHRAVAFSNRYYRQAGLSFRQGDAQALPLADASTDVVLNVESSHRYPHMARFLSEVKRVLRPGGHLLFADFRWDFELPALQHLLQATGLHMVRQENITGGVVAALQRDHLRKVDLVRRLAPCFLRRTALNFAGTVGSPTYDSFASGRYAYWLAVLRKG